MPVTSIEHVEEVLGVQPGIVRVVQGYAAAESAVASLCCWPEGDVPGALVEAVVLRTARYIARVDSPSGVVGFGEYGPVRIQSVDRDIESLEGPWRKVVFS